VRFGFPVLDRMGHRYFPCVGYMGALRLMEKMTDAMLDHKDRECADEYFELIQ
jgi:nitrogenase molybdenum-iron protein beta chain